MENITKKDDYTIEIATTSVATKTITLEELIFDRDSLIRTQEANSAEVTNKNAQIQTLITALNGQIDLAILAGVIVPAVVVPDTTPDTAPAEVTP